MDLVPWLVDNLVVIVVVAVLGVVALQVWWEARRKRKSESRNEALFVSMFPELQPYFHPKKLVEFVRARRAMKPPQGGKVWANPPGFGVHDADIRMDPQGRETVRLRDAAGTVLSGFVFEEHAEGGVLRLGKGKLTVNIRDAAPRVRYWHPDKEFKWSQPKGWTFVTRMSEDSFSDRDTSSSSSSSSSSFGDTARSAGAAGAFAGAGGAFDGGGASQAWDDGGGGTSTATSY